MCEKKRDHDQALRRPSSLTALKTLNRNKSTPFSQAEFLDAQQVGYLQTTVMEGSGNKRPHRLREVHAQAVVRRHCIAGLRAHPYGIKQEIDFIRKGCGATR